MSICQNMNCQRPATRRIIKSNGQASLRCQPCYDKRMAALKGKK